MVPVQVQTKEKVMGKFDYVKFDDLSIEKTELLKGEFTALEQVLSASLIPGREKSLVMTKLEEAWMWVGKSIKAEQAQRNHQADGEE
jgi:hypothetical protein